MYVAAVGIALAITIITLLSQFLATAFALEEKADNNNNKILILPGSKDNSYNVYFDYPFFMAGPDEQIVWSNPDDVTHRLSITDDQGKQIATEKTLNPGGSASMVFKSPGMYHVTCMIYPWMKSDVLISDLSATAYHNSTSSKVVTKLSWSPSMSNLDGKTYFRLEFLDRATGQRHEHIDYGFSILDAKGGVVVDNGVHHSSSGLDFLPYEFKGAGPYTVVVSIKQVNWIPVMPDDATFGMAVTPEFPSGLAAIGPVLVVLLALTVFVRHKVRLP